MRYFDIIVLMIILLNTSLKSQSDDTLKTIINNEVDEITLKIKSDTNDYEGKSFLDYLIIKSGFGYHNNRHDYLFNITEGYFWDLGAEVLLDTKHIWSLEFNLFRWYSNYNDFHLKNDRLIVSFLVNYYFPYFGSFFYPSIRVGASPYILFTWDAGLNFGFRIYNNILMELGSAILWRHHFCMDCGPDNYSPMIFKINFCYRFNR